MRFHHVDVLIARRRQPGGKIARIEPVCLRNMNDMLFKLRARHQPVHPRVRRQHERAKLARYQAANRFQPPDGEIAAGSGAAHKRNFPRGQQRRRARQQRVHILHNPLPHDIVGHDHHQGASGCLHQRGQHMGALRFLHAIGVGHAGA